MQITCICHHILHQYFFTTSPHFATTYAIDRDSPCGLKESPVMWYNPNQSDYWKRHNDAEVSIDSVEARIWEAVRWVKAHIRYGERKSAAVESGQPKTLDQLDDSEVAMEDKD